MHRHPPLTALLLVVLLAGLVSLVPAQAQEPAVQPAVIAYSESFDASNGGYTVSGYTSWAWGAPTIGAHSPPNVWATNPTGNYYDYENGYLTSPNVDLAAASGSCTLSWWQWRETESCCDHVSTEISSNGGSTWATIYGPVYGSYTSWQPITYVMGEGYNTDQFRVRFHFVTDSSVTYRGWYIDDVTVDCPTIGPKLGTSTKTATAEVVSGEPIPYTVQVVNSAPVPAQEAALLDPIPDGTAYVTGSLACTAGTCYYDSGSDRIVWNGQIAAGASVTVTFQVDTDGLPCGTEVVNSATISAAQAVSVTRQATTRIAGLRPLFTESFDATTFPPADWSVFNRDGDGTTWVRRTTTPHSGAGTAFHVFSPVLMQDGWLVTPRFTATAELWLSFWQRDTYPYGSYYGRHSVQVTAGANPNPGISTYTEIWSGDTQPTWEQTWVDLRAYAGQEVYLAFRYEGRDADNWYIDDVMITPPWYPCPAAALSPSQAVDACRATDVTYALVAGHNYLTDTFDLSPLGNSWPTIVQPPTITFPMAGNTPVTITVRVPWDAIPGMIDTVTLHLAGRTYALSATATLATTAIRGTWAAQWEDLAITPDSHPFGGASYYADGDICVVGGIVPWTWVASNMHACYDISAAAWFTRTTLPTAVAQPAYGLIDGKFYIAGGFVGDRSNATSLVQVYDLATGAWYTDTAAPLPTARGGQAGGVVDGKLYSAGGSATSFPYPADCPTYEYDPLANAWTERASCPLQSGYGLFKGGSVGSSYHHRLFAGGHEAFLGVPSGWYAYDPAADTWQALALLLPSVNQTPLIVEDPGSGIIYQVGGMDNYWYAQSAVNAYDYLSDTWSESPPDLAIAAGGAVGPAYGSFGDPDVEGIWAAGGWGASGALYAFQLWEFASCPALVPDIAVTPGVLPAAQCPDSSTTHTTEVCNEGYAPLNWAVDEVTRTRGLAAPEGLTDVPWLSAAPLTGSLAVRECQPVTVTLNSAGLEPGDYLASLLIVSDDPDTPTVTVPVTLTVDEPAVAAFTATSPICLGEDAAFTNLSSGTAPLWYNWGFGDGGTSTETNAMYLYAAAGIYTVTLTAENGCGQDEAQALFTVNPLPAASFTYSPAFGYLPLTVYFTDTSADAISPTWSFGDGGTGAGANVSHTYTGTGDYSVTLTVQSPSGCGTSTATGLVRAAEPGVPLAGFASSTPDCLGDTTVFTNTTVGTGTIVYEWAFGDGTTSTAVHPTHVYTAAGAFTVILTATNATAQSDTVSHEVVVEESVGGMGIAFWPAGPTVTTTVYFTASVASGTAPITFAWDLGDGTTATGLYVSHTFALAGVYTATLHGTNACGGDTAAVQVTVINILPTRFDIYLPLVTRNS